MGAPVVASVHVGSAVDGELVLVGARSVDVIGIETARARLVTIEQARDAGYQLHIIQHIAAVYGDVVELFVRDHVGTLAGVGLQLKLAGIGGDGHGFSVRPHCQHELAGVELVGGA